MAKKSRFWPTDIDSFIKSTIRNCWIEEGKYKLYVRQSQRMVDRRIYRTFEIPSVSTKTPGQGGFAELLKICERDPRAEMLYVECVLNERLREWLLRNGFTYHNNRCEPPSYWREIVRPAT